MWCYLLYLNRQIKPCWLLHPLYHYRNETPNYNIKFISKKYHTSSTILENRNLNYLNIWIYDYSTFHFWLLTCFHALTVYSEKHNLNGQYFFINFLVSRHNMRSIRVYHILFYITHSLNASQKIISGLKIIRLK